MIGPRSGSADATPAPAVNDNARPPTATASRVNDSLIICGLLPTDRTDSSRLAQTLRAIRNHPRADHAEDDDEDRLAVSAQPILQLHYHGLRLRRRHQVADKPSPPSAGCARKARPRNR